MRKLRTILVIFGRKRYGRMVDLMRDNEELFKLNGKPTKARDDNDRWIHFKDAGGKSDML